MKKTSLIVLMALCFTACLGSDFADSVEGSWQLIEGTVAGEAVPVIESHPITMTFEGQQVNGTASCNGYGGSFELDGSDITIGSLSMTEMACMPEETMAAERLFATALTMVDTVRVDETLTLEGSEVELVFEALEPVPDSELTNTVWVLDGLIDGDAVSTPAPNVRATVEFLTDSSMLGDTGCRPFSGSYQVEGAEVVVTELAADGHECEPELADQDTRFISALEGGFKVDIDGERLTISARGGEGLAFIAGS